MVAGGVVERVGVGVDVFVAVEVGFGVRVLVAEGAGVDDFVTVGVGFGVRVLVAIGVSVDVFVTVEVGFGIRVLVAEGAGVDVFVAVRVGFGVDVLVAEGAGVDVFVAVGVEFGVEVLVAEGVGIDVLVAVGVGFSVGVLVAEAVGVVVLVDVGVLELVGVDVDLSGIVGVSEKIEGRTVLCFFVGEAVPTIGWSDCGGGTVGVVIAVSEINTSPDNTSSLCSPLGVGVVKLTAVLLERKVKRYGPKSCGMRKLIPRIPSDIMTMMTTFVFAVNWLISVPVLHPLPRIDVPAILMNMWFLFVL